MKLHQTPENFGQTACVLTIGTFDGVHRGHNHLLHRLRDRAHALGLPSAVLTFWPHPRMVLHPEDTSLSLLNTLDERVELLRQQGVDHVIVQEFTPEFSALSSCEFVENILIKKLNVKHLVVGFNHAFGRNREGNYAYLEQCAANYGFGIERIDALHIRSIDISSTKVREALQAGQIETANLYLNRPYSLTGTVVRGKQLGRTIGFPTANVQAEAYKLIPQNGAYAVLIHTQSGNYQGMLNIGTRPTVQGETRNVEVHLLDFDGDLYGQSLTVFFAHYIRPERRFANVQALAEQLMRDKAYVAHYFAEKPLEIYS